MEIYAGLWRVGIVCLFVMGVLSKECNDFVWHKPVDEPWVAFSVASSVAQSPSSWLLLPFEKTFYNDGGFFRSDNYFYAPYAGVYLFYFCGTSPGNGYDMSVHLYTQKSGKDTVHITQALDNRGLSNSNGGASASVMIKMEANETAAVWLQGGYRLMGNSGPTTLFWGELRKRL